MRQYPSGKSVILLFPICLYWILRYPTKYEYTQLGFLQHECCLSASIVTRVILGSPSVSLDPVCFQSFTDLSYLVSLELCLLYLSAQRIELIIKVLGFASQQQVLKTFPGLGSVGLVMFGCHLNERKCLVVETVPFGVNLLYIYLLM